MTAATMTKYVCAALMWTTRRRWQRQRDFQPKHIEKRSTIFRRRSTFSCTTNDGRFSSTFSQHEKTTSDQTTTSISYFFFLSFCPFCWCCIVVYSMAAFSISLFVRMVAFDKSCPSENSFHRARTAHSTIGNARARTLLSSRVRNQLSNRMNIFFVQLRCSASCEGQNRRHFFHLFEWDAVVVVFSCSHFTWFSLFWNIASRQHSTHTHTHKHIRNFSILILGHIRVSTSWTKTHVRLLTAVFHLHFAPHVTSSHRLLGENCLIRRSTNGLRVRNSSWRGVRLLCDVLVHVCVRAKVNAHAMRMSIAQFTSFIFYFYISPQSPTTIRHLHPSLTLAVVVVIVDVDFSISTRSPFFAYRIRSTIF